MASYVIEGGYSLSGEITPQGAKNEALQIISAVLLTPEVVTIHNIPNILDVNNLIDLLRQLGVKVEKLPEEGSYTFQADEVNLEYLHSEQFLQRSRALRGSIMTVGALLGRFGFGVFPKPGGDKIGRKKTLVASLVLMGGSTVVIGLLPTYSQIGIWAPILLCICRVGQGIGLGGEWGGAALVATENAPEGKRAWYGTFPQLGAPIGLFVANATFFLVSYFWGQQALVEWAWRIPFVSSLALVLVGLYVRLTLHESHVFVEAEEKGKKLKAPVSVVFTKHFKPMVIGTFIMVACYVLFYLMTAWILSYGIGKVNAGGLGIPYHKFLEIQLISIIGFALFIPVSGWLADKYGRRPFILTGSLSLLFLHYHILL